MKTIENKTIYRCDGCGKVYLRKNACEKHEKHCQKIETNRACCFSCAHFEESEYESDGYSFQMATPSYCKQRAVMLIYGRGIVNKRLIKHIEEIGCECLVAPHECEHYEAIGGVNNAI